MKPFLLFNLIDNEVKVVQFDIGEKNTTGFTANLFESVGQRSPIQLLTLWVTRRDIIYSL